MNNWFIYEHIDDSWNFSPVTLAHTSTSGSRQAPVPFNFETTLHYARTVLEMLPISVDENVSFSAVCQRTSSMKLAKAVIILGTIISDADVKTDPIDARKIANILHVGMIPQCYAVSPTLRDARELLRYRIGVVQTRTALINYVHGLVLSKS